VDYEKILENFSWGSWKVMASSGFFWWVKEWEPCAVLLAILLSHSSNAFPILVYYLLF